METQLISEQTYGEMFDSLISRDYEKLSDVIKITSVKAKLASRSPDAASPEHMRKIGELEGFLRAFRDIMEYEQEKVYVQELSANTQYFDKVLLYIKANEGVQHKQLAQHLEISPSHLCNIMKKVISTNTVDCANRGKYSYYYLTELGKSYCKQKTKMYSEEEVDEKIKEVLLETLKELYSSGFNCSLGYLADKNLLSNELNDILRLLNFKVKSSYAKFSKIIQNSNSDNQYISRTTRKQTSCVNGVLKQKAPKQKALNNAI